MLQAIQILLGKAAVQLLAPAVLYLGMGLLLLGTTLLAIFASLGILPFWCALLTSDPFCMCSDSSKHTKQHSGASTAAGAGASRFFELIAIALDNPAGNLCRRRAAWASRLPGPAHAGLPTERGCCGCSGRACCRLEAQKALKSLIGWAHRPCKPWAAGMFAISACRPQRLMLLPAAFVRTGPEETIGLFA